jgi:hypothetical protein
MKKLSIEELTKLSTKRLLNYYRLQRRHKYSYICPCCDEFLWDIHESDMYLKKDYDILMEYLAVIKEILNKREHVQKSHQKSNNICKLKECLKSCTKKNRRNQCLIGVIHA